MPTSKDVARLAGVSQSSVCRVFDQKWDDKVSSQLREKVLTAANELGYAPNAIARSLTARHSGIIGVVISEDFNEFYYDILRRIANELQRRRMRVMLFNAEPYENLNLVFDKLVEYRVDGIIVTAAAASTMAEPFAWDVKTPLVLLNIYSKRPFCNSVISDNYTGSYKMASYLYDCGCRKFAYVSAGKSIYFDIPDRKSGFLDCLTNYGITDCLLYEGDYSYQSGKEIGRQIFGKEIQRPDCIFSCGSRMAYGIMDVARYEYGLSIPDDISIAAYDDHIASELDSYQLTAVQQSADELVTAAVRLLCQELDEHSNARETIYIPTTLKIRNSVRKLKSEKTMS